MRVIARLLAFLTRLRAWGLEACALGKHAFEPCDPPWEEMGDGVTFAVNFSIAFDYQFFRCKRCGVRGQRPWMLE